MRPVGGSGVLALSLALTGASMPVAPVGAQESVAGNRQARSGVLVAAGLASAAAKFSGRADPIGGPGLVVRVAAQSPRLSGGVEAHGWVGTTDTDTRTVSVLLGSLNVYPWTRGGFFIAGGGGVAMVTRSGSDPRGGLALMLGLGYDARVGRTISITPFLNAVGLGLDGSRVGVGELGASVTFH